MVARFGSVAAVVGSLGTFLLLAGCGERAAQGPAAEVSVPEGPAMPAPPIPLEDLDAAVAKACGLNIAEWRRTYGARWLRPERRYDPTQVSFVVEAGPYPDLKPGRAWRDVREVLRIDDRPNTRGFFGHYDTRSQAMSLEQGSCPSGVSAS